MLSFLYAYMWQYDNDNYLTTAGNSATCTGDSEIKTGIIVLMSVIVAIILMQH